MRRILRPAMLPVEHGRRDPDDLCVNPIAISTAAFFATLTLPLALLLSD
jgi:hypothetical protein